MGGLNSCIIKKLPRNTFVFGAYWLILVPLAALSTFPSLRAPNSPVLWTPDFPTTAVAGQPTECAAKRPICHVDARLLLNPIGAKDTREECSTQRPAVMIFSRAPEGFLPFPWCGALDANLIAI